MGTFELERGLDRRNEHECENTEALAAARGDARRIKQECIIALKVYDHCRQPDCIIQLQKGYENRYIYGRLLLRKLNTALTAKNVFALSR